MTTVLFTVSSFSEEILSCCTSVSLLGASTAFSAAAFGNVIFGVTADFFVGEAAVRGDFPTDVRGFAALGVPDKRPIVLGTGDALKREICLLAVSLLCLSINGDFAGVVLPLLSRGLSVPAEDGAVFGLVAPVDSCFDGEEGEVEVLADAGLGFDEKVNSGLLVVVDVVVDVLTSVVFAIAPLEVLAAAAAAFIDDLAAAILSAFASPFVDFFSADFASPFVDFLSTVIPVLEAAATFGFAARRGETVVIVDDVVVFIVATVVDVVVLAAVILLLVVLVTLLAPSGCLKRDTKGFFAAADCVVVVLRAIAPVTFVVDDNFVVGVVFVVVLFVAGLFVVVEDDTFASFALLAS